MPRAGLLRRQPLVAGWRAARATSSSHSALCRRASDQLGRVVDEVLLHGRARAARFAASAATGQGSTGLPTSALSSSAARMACSTSASAGRAPSTPTRASTRASKSAAPLRSSRCRRAGCGAGGTAGACLLTPTSVPARSTTLQPQATAAPQRARDNAQSTAGRVLIRASIPGLRPPRRRGGSASGRVGARAGRRRAVRGRPARCRPACARCHASRASGRSSASRRT